MLVWNLPQVACPRLSIDWGEEFTLPTLNPYEVREAGWGEGVCWRDGGMQVGRVEGATVADSHGCKG